MAGEKGILQELTTLAQMAPLLNKPARDLSEQEAFDFMMFLAQTGEIQLFDKVVTDKSGNITSHRPGAQTRIVPEMKSIPFLRASSSNNGNNGSVGAKQQPFFSPTPSFAIVLFKLATMLDDDWDASQIVYGGIGAGGTAGVADCHATGRCVDFYGANTKKGNFDVRRDWWLRPVWDKLGNVHPSEGAGWGVDRWKNETKTFFRLAFSLSPEDAPAAEFFEAIYEFAHGEARAAAFDINPFSFGMGEPLKSGWILHPDYPKKDPKGRMAHNDHMHFQLGNT